MPHDRANTLVLPRPITPVAVATSHIPRFLPANAIVMLPDQDMGSSLLQRVLPYIAEAAASYFRLLPTRRDFFC